MSIVQKVNRLIGERPGVFLGTAATSGAGGTVSLIMSPLLISALISGLDLSEKSAGFIATSEFLTIAFVSFLIAPKMGVWPRRSTALCGALIAIVGHACSAFAVDVGSLTIARMVAGIGAGMMLAAGNAVVASANNPDKLYSILMIVTGAAHLLLLGLGPIFTTRWSYPGAYGIEVVFLLCLLPFVWLLPQHRDADASGALKAEDSHQPFPLGSAIMICLAMTIFFARDSALWGFSQEIGRRTGMEDQTIGAVLGLTGFIGLLGAVAVAILNVRYGRLLPMISGLAVLTILSLGICLTSNAVVFSFGIVFWQAATFFTAPYIFGIAAELDPQGRVIAACGGCLLLGASLGPVIAGTLMDLGGYNAVAIFIGVAMLAAMVLAVKANNDLGKTA